MKSILFFFITISLSAQIRGVVKDSISGEPIPYVNIWVENGVIGLALHFLAISYVIVMGFYNTYKTKNPDLKQKHEFTGGK